MLRFLRSISLALNYSYFRALWENVNGFPFSPVGLACFLLHGFGRAIVEAEGKIVVAAINLTKLIARLTLRQRALFGPIFQLVQLVFFRARVTMRKTNGSYSLFVRRVVPCIQRFH